MYQRLSIFLIFVLIFSCKNETTEVKQLPNRIVMLFENPPINYKYTFENGAYKVNSEKHEISFFDDMGHSQKYTLNHDQEDTIVIHVARKVVEVGHAYKGLEMWYYLFQNGDSVLFTYDGLKPTAKILNRSVSDFEINYDLERKEFLDHDDFSELSKYKNAMFLSGVDLRSKNARDEIYQFQKKMLKEAEDKYKLESEILDSLVAGGQISGAYKQYKITKSAIDLKVMELSLELDSRPKEPMRLEQVAEAFVLEDGLKSEGLSNTLFGGDSNNYYHGYHKLLDILLFKYFYKKADHITSSLQVNGIKQAGSSMPDYKQVYDSIFATKLIGARDKKYLLTKTIESIMNQSDLDSRVEYFAKFKSTFQDTVFIDYLTSKYQLDIEDDYDIKLVSLTGDTITYDNLIKKQLGKAIFLDFWASWCGPCVKEMPASKELQNHYKGKEISFLYISNDIDVAKWESAARKYGIDKNNYRIINTYSSRQWEEMEISYIPTYMIFKKNGDLWNRYAPRPSDKKLIVLLDQALLYTSPS